MQWAAPIHWSNLQQIMLDHWDYIREHLCFIILQVFGTSLAVSPFNTMVGKPSSGVPRVYINRSPPGAAGGLLPWIMGLGANISFSQKTDLIVQSDCDKTVRQLCSQLAWTDDLEKLEVKILEA